MEVKTFEIRDRGTFVPALAVCLSARNSAEAFLLRRAGFGMEKIISREYILLHKLESNTMHYDPFGWGGASRTMNVAHLYIQQNWATLNNGDVICVEHILGEREHPKTTERLP